LHHLQRGAGTEGAPQPGQVGLQRRPHISLHHSGLGAGDQARPRRHRVGQRHLLETEALQPGPQLLLMAGMAGGMQQRHGTTAQTIGARLGQGCGQRGIQQERLKLVAIGRQAARHLQRPGVQRLGAADLERKQIRAVLIADA
jgi:hypothetical protein